MSLVASIKSFLVSILLSLNLIGPTSLLSPLIHPKPDLAPQISKTIKKLPSLDYSKATTLSTLSDSIAYLVFNPQTFKVYAAKDHDAQFSPASFTKLLTTQVALDLSTPNQLLTATKQAIDKEPTILGLKATEQLTVSELVRGSISTSANDAAAVLASGVADQFNQEPDFFVEIMNQKAQLLGLSNSHFANPEGYDDPVQFSTLADVAKLVYNSLEYPEIVSAGSADRVDISTTYTHGFYYLPNWNGLLGVYPGVSGLKIAYTELAGYSTIVTASRSGIPVIVILTHADSIRERDLAAAALLDAAYISEKVSPANIRRAHVDQRYKQWSDLAKQIKEELSALGSQD